MSTTCTSGIENWVTKEEAVDGYKKARQPTILNMKLDTLSSKRGEMVSPTSLWFLRF
jgi:hypothetical protein